MFLKYIIFIIHCEVRDIRRAVLSLFTLRRAG
ncbi:hypothetical protein DK095_600087 [Flavobacterium psychrophilum]|nr:hypothetical protein DK095_600087 [Flavobacterium psychrophilum]